MEVPALTETSASNIRDDGAQASLSQGLNDESKEENQCASNWLEKKEKANRLASPLDLGKGLELSRIQRPANHPGSKADRRRCPSRRDLSLGKAGRNQSGRDPSRVRRVVVAPARIHSMDIR